MEVCTIGGYEEVGKNMTAVKIGDDVIIFDAGVFLPALVEIQEVERNRGERQEHGYEFLQKSGALPDDSVLDKLGWRDKVRALIIGHAHLDHIGAVPYIAPRYPNAKILATPFTMEFLERTLRDEKINLRNKKIRLNENSTYMLHGKSGDYKVEFIHATHSTIQCVFVVLYTPEGTFFYTLDFKLDDHPVVGQPPNYKRLAEIAKKGVDVLVIDSLYSGTERKTPSERIARDLVEDAIASVRNKDSALLVSTFSSHIVRLKSIVEFGKKTGRKIVFLGRSLERYVECATNVKQCSFRNSVMILKYRKQINSFLRKVNQEKGKYLVVCTGHQAEKGSVLDRITKGETPLELSEGDNVIFSSSVIPTEVNIKARAEMDSILKKKGVRIQSDVHVSGHGSREDLRDLLEILKPKHIIPAHGSIDIETPMIELASEVGYKSGVTSHLSSNGKVLKF